MLFLFFLFFIFFLITTEKAFHIVLVVCHRKKEENERLGYERWLQQRQQEKADRLSRTVTATSRSRRDYTDRDDETEDGGPQTIGALRLYLRSLGRSKAGVPYEKWLTDKEREVNALPVGTARLQRA